MLVLVLKTDSEDETKNLLACVENQA